jgi:hypothetical protein
LKTRARLVLFGSDLEVAQATAPGLVTSSVSGGSVVLGTVPLRFDASYLPVVVFDASYTPIVVLEGKSQ